MEDFKKLNEELRQFLERDVKDSIEKVTDSANDYVDEFRALIDNHEYNGDKTIAEILLPRIDDVTVEQIKSIMDDYSLVGQEQSIFPSNWNPDLGPYPVKFAEALSKSTSAENDTDIFNVFYCNRDEALFEDAIQVWKGAVLKDVSEHNCNTLNLMDSCGEEYVADVYSEIQEHYPDFVELVAEVAKKPYGIDLLAIIDENK